MPDAELPEDAREMPFDGAVGEEERCRDLAVRLALGDERGDALLGGRERARRRRAAADPLQLGACALRPERRADPLEDRERLLERLARLAPTLRAPLRGAEREQRAPAVERKLDLRMPLERLLVRRERGVELARLCREQPAAARAVGERRRALEPPARCPRTSRAARPLPRAVRARSAPRSGRRRSGSRRARRCPPRRTKATPGSRSATTSLGSRVTSSRWPSAADADELATNSVRRRARGRAALRPAPARSSQLRLDEALECEVERAEERLT